MDWKQMIWGSITMVCLAFAVWIMTIHIAETSVINCERKAQMIEKLVEEHEEGVIIINDGGGY